MAYRNTCPEDRFQIQSCTGRIQVWSTFRSRRVSNRTGHICGCFQGSPCNLDGRCIFPDWCRFRSCRSSSSGVCSHTCWWGSFCSQESRCRLQVLNSWSFYRVTCILVRILCCLVVCNRRSTPFEVGFFYEAKSTVGIAKEALLAADGFL